RVAICGLTRAPRIIKRSTTCATTRGRTRPSSRLPTSSPRLTPGWPDSPMITSCACLRPGRFFSSSRRNTRWPRDWSSDVCSSDLRTGGYLFCKKHQDNGKKDSRQFGVANLEQPTGQQDTDGDYKVEAGVALVAQNIPNAVESVARSEERRVGKV